MKQQIITLCFAVLLIFSCEEIIEVDDISQERVDILAPVDNVSLTSNNVTFSWQALNAAEAYQLQIATPSFAEAIQIIEDTTITRTSYTRMLDASNYQWRITALNSAFVSQTETLNFTIED